MRVSEVRSVSILTPVAEPAGESRSAARLRLPEPSFSIRRFKVEAIGLALLLATLAAIQFQDLFIHRMVRLTAVDRTLYVPYAYDDKVNGGNSSIDADLTGKPLSWSCELRTAYQYPFCGYGLLFDQKGNGEGRDFSKIKDVTIRLRVSGAADKLRLIVKNADKRYGLGPTGAKPNELEIPVVQGDQTLHVELDGLTVPPWWLDQYKIPKLLSEPQRENVTAIELQPGSGSKPGHYAFQVESISFEGRQMSQAQYYLLLLGGWAVLIAFFLFRRVLGMHRKFESRHRRQLREARELEFARAVAERSSAAKSAFLANMSHELRTPLNAILGYAQLLEQAGLSDREAGAARTIRQSGTHLLTLITDILDLSKIEAGRLELVPGPLDLSLCVTGVADMMRIRAAEKGIGFRCEIDAEAPSHVVGDEKRLRQVLINLLGNAIKFTDKGEVTLRLRSLGRGAIRIEVCDTGVGMAESALETIFEAFEQTGSAASRAGGTGLGLSISRRIVELMGGAIHVESTEGSGSRFWFDVTLPRADALPAPSEAPALPGPAAPALAGPAEPPMVAPAEDRLQVLLKLAKAGNMRAIRAFADSLEAEDPDHGPFADRLKTLAAGYQSPAILDLVSRYTPNRKAA